MCFACIHMLKIIFLFNNDIITQIYFRVDLSFVCCFFSLENHTLRTVHLHFAWARRAVAHVVRLVDKNGCVCDLLTDCLLLWSIKPEKWINHLHPPCIIQAISSPSLRWAKTINSIRNAHQIDEFIWTHAFAQNTNKIKVISWQTRKLNWTENHVHFNQIKVNLYWWLEMCHRWRMW